MSTRLLLHIAFWLVYLLEDTLLEYVWIRDSFKDLDEIGLFMKALHGNFALLPVKMIFVYFVIYAAIENGLQKNKKIFTVITWVSLMLVVSVILHRVIMKYYVNAVVYKEAWEALELFDARRIFSAILDIGFVAGGAVALKLLRMHMIDREREKNLVKEKLEAELKFLKTQTNPHFLFNTLNNIYALARKKSDDTADVVMKLSKLLRFMLYEARKNRIALGDEIRMIEDYLELEKIRYNERLTTRFEKFTDSSNAEIAPMILLPFIENAFKHGAGETRFQSYINICLKLQNGILNFNIENSKDLEDTGELRENIELSNVRRQLELMYRDYDLQLNNGATKFSVNLKLNLNPDAAI